MRAAIVCGPRTGTGFDAVADALDQASIDDDVPAFDYVVVGGATGTDYQAWRWAVSREMIAVTVPAQWTSSGRGRGAGPERNRKMLELAQPVVVLAFLSDGPGTKHMTDHASAMGTPVFWWGPDDGIWVLDERCKKPRRDDGESTSECRAITVRPT